jgi:hypothetical protein
MRTAEERAELEERSARVRLAGFRAVTGSHVGGGWLLFGFQRVELALDERVEDYVLGFRGSWWWLDLRVGYAVLTDRRLLFVETWLSKLLPPWRHRPFVLTYDEVQVWRVERRRNMLFPIFPKPALVLRTMKGKEYVFWKATPRFAEAARRVLPPSLPMSS